MAIQQGWNQMPAAVQHLMSKALGRVGGKRSAKRRRKLKAKTGRKRRHTRGKKKGRVRLVAGSAAAKAWGRKMKALRKRK